MANDGKSGGRSGGLNSGRTIVGTRNASMSDRSERSSGGSRPASTGDIASRGGGNRSGGRFSGSFSSREAMANTNESDLSRQTRGSRPKGLDDLDANILDGYEDALVAAEESSDPDAFKYTLAVDIVNSNVGNEQTLGDNAYKQAIDAVYDKMNPSVSGRTMRGENLATDFINFLDDGIDAVNYGIGTGIDWVWDNTVGNVGGLLGMGGGALGNLFLGEDNDLGKVFEQSRDNVADLVTPETGAMVSDMLIDVGLAAVPGIGTGLVLGKNAIQNSENIYEFMTGADDITGEQLDPTQWAFKGVTGIGGTALSALPGAGNVKNANLTAQLGAEQLADTLPKLQRASDIVDVMRRNSDDLATLGAPLPETVQAALRNSDGLVDLARHADDMPADVSAAIRNYDSLVNHADDIPADVSAAINNADRMTDALAKARYDASEIASQYPHVQVNSPDELLGAGFRSSSDNLVDPNMAPPPINPYDQIVNEISRANAEVRMLEDMAAQYDDELLEIVGKWNAGSPTVSATADQLDDEVLDAVSRWATDSSNIKATANQLDDEVLDAIAKSRPRDADAIAELGQSFDDALLDRMNDMYRLEDAADLARLDSRANTPAAFVDSLRNYGPSFRANMSNAAASGRSGNANLVSGHPINAFRDYKDALGSVRDAFVPPTSRTTAMRDLVAQMRTAGSGGGRGIPGLLVSGGKRAAQSALPSLAGYASSMLAEYGNDAIPAFNDAFYGAADKDFILPFLMSVAAPGMRRASGGLTNPNGSFSDFSVPIMATKATGAAKHLNRYPIASDEGYTSPEEAAQYIAAASDSYDDEEAYPWL